MTSPAYILTLSCPDRTGIVHAVSGFLLERGGNIEEAAQFNDHDTGLFFMRVRFACGAHNIVPEVEMIDIQHINQAYGRLLKSDVKYRFVIDMKSLKKA